MKEKEYYIKATDFVLRQLDATTVKSFYEVAKKLEKEKRLTQKVDTNRSKSPQVACL